MTLDEMILKAVPFNGKCAIEESYNRVKRDALKKRILEYTAEQIKLNERPEIEYSNKMAHSAD